MVTTDLSVATGVQETLADPTKSSSFAAEFTTALVENEAASGRTIEVKEVAPSVATVTSKTETVVITPPAPAPAPPAPAPPAPAPSPSATPAPSPPAEEEEEESSDNGAVIGGVVGGIVGVAVLGGAFYAYKKKSAQE